MKYKWFYPYFELEGNKGHETKHEIYLEINVFTQL